MAERVEILVVATDSASQILRGVTGSFGELGNAIQNITGGRALEYLTSAVINFGKESIKTFTEGAMAAKELSRASGTSIEDASRFIEVLDDFGLKQQDALTATRALTKQGLVPNIETLAKLSDQYREIKDPQERNEFILKNLGRAGMQWAQVLEQGSDALKEHAKSIDTNLIYTEKMYQEAEKMRIAEDTMNESFQKVKITVGNELVPVLTDGMDAFNNTTRAIQIMREEGLNPTWEMLTNSDGYINALRQADEETQNQRNSMLRNAEASGEMTTAHEKTKEELKAEEDAMKALTKANEDYLSLVGDLAGNLTDYENKHSDIEKQLRDGKITLGEAQTAWKNLADEQEKATYRMILNMLQQRLAVDGLDSAETQFLLQQGLEWGIYSQTAVDKANEIMRNVDALVGKYNSVPRMVTTDIVSNYVTNYSVDTLGIQRATSGKNAGLSKLGGGKAGGGDVMAGMLYPVNETRTEYFQPAMNGTIVPLGDGGGNNKGFTFVYAPQLSLGNAREAQTVIAPMVENAIRRMQSDGRAAL